MGHHEPAVTYSAVASDAGVAFVAAMRGSIVLASPKDFAASTYARRSNVTSSSSSASSVQLSRCIAALKPASDVIAWLPSGSAVGSAYQPHTR